MENEIQLPVVAEEIEMSTESKKQEPYMDEATPEGHDKKLAVSSTEASATISASADADPAPVADITAIIQDAEMHWAQGRAYNQMIMQQQKVQET